VESDKSQYASQCQNVVEIIQLTVTVAEKQDFFLILKMAAVRHLGFVECIYKDHPRTAIGGLCRCAECG